MLHFNLTSSQISQFDWNLHSLYATPRTWTIDEQAFYMHNGVLVKIIFLATAPYENQCHPLVKTLMVGKCKISSRVELPLVCKCHCILVKIILLGKGNKWITLELPLVCKCHCILLQEISLLEKCNWWIPPSTLWCTCGSNGWMVSESWVHAPILMLWNCRQRCHCSPNSK